MTDPLTLRIDNGHILISTDDGATAELPPEVARSISEEVQASLAHLRLRFDRLSAVTVASLAEAQRASPRETEWQVGVSEVEGTHRLRIGRLAGPVSRPLAEILAERRSWRTLGPLMLTDLATVLVRAGRVSAWVNGPDGFQLTHRPAPSAGGRHPCELLICAVDVVDLPSGWWGFDATRCDLVRVDGAEFDVTSSAETVRAVLGMEGLPPAVIFAVAHLPRTLSRYPAGTSLVWRDAGVLLGLLHLCAADLTLGSCIVGLGGVLPLKLPRVDVGAVAIGSILADVPAPAK